MSCSLTKYFIWSGNCSTHGNVTSANLGWLSSPPVLCPVASDQPFTDPIPIQNRPYTHFQVDYTNTVSVSALSTSFTVVGYMRFPGTDCVGYIDTIEAIGTITSGTGGIRIRDITNGSVTVVQYTSISGSTPVIYNLGTVSNLSTNTAIWEIALNNTLLSTLTVYSITAR